MISKAFNATQLRWSAMERELYALWQSVVGHERFIRGLLVFVYIDHKNNLFIHAMLDNRRIGKKVGNWALELQCFNIVRIWIRGEANVLADAPSRAPWECELAKHLVVPNTPVQTLINEIYQPPEGWDEKFNKLGEKLPDWKPLTHQSGKEIPKFGIDALRIASLHVVTDLLSSL